MSSPPSGALPWRSPVRLPSARDTAAVLALAAAAALAGWLAVEQVELRRLLLAAALVLNLVIVGVRWPRAAAVVTLLFLPFLALVRRLLIAESGWTAIDPLLLVGPVVAAFLLVVVLGGRQTRLRGDILVKLVVALLVVTVIQVVNPASATGFVANVAGLIYLGVPLLWFLLGRELADRRTGLALITSTAIIGLAVGAYGLWQTELGSLPRWDLDWLQITGYQALFVGNIGDNVIRPFSTFSSNAEYAAYVGVGMVFTAVLALHGRVALAVFAPALLVATFLAGGRGVFVLVLLTLVLVAAVRTRSVVYGVPVAVAGVVATLLAALAFGDAIDRMAGLYGNAVVQRNVGGLLAPLDPKQSTLLTHWDSLVAGVGQGFTNPVGQGTGATSIAATRLQDEGGAIETDNDLADAFVALGLAGGLLYTAVILLVVWRLFSGYRRTGDVVTLAVIGLLFVTAGNWLNGGHYALAPLTWFLVGYATIRRDLPPGDSAEASALERTEEHQTEASEFPLSLGSETVPAGARSRRVPDAPRSRPSA